MPVGQAELQEVQRAFGAAADVRELFARAAGEACRWAGSRRAVVADIAGGRVTARTTHALSDRPSDALRLRLLQEPLLLTAKTPEAAAVRLAETGRPVAVKLPSSIAAHLELDAPAFGVVAPEGQALALLVVDAPKDADRVVLLAHLLGTAVESVVLRRRISDLRDELRYLTASTNAMLREAESAPISLASDDLRPTFREAGAEALAADVWRDVLSTRELEIARLVAEGLTNREIGAHLNLSSETVKSHVTQVLLKLGAANRVQAATRLLQLERRSPT